MTEAIAVVEHSCPSPMDRCGNRHSSWGVNLTRSDAAARPEVIHVVLAYMCSSVSRSNNLGAQTTDSTAEAGQNTWEFVLKGQQVFLQPLCRLMIAQ